MIKKIKKKIRKIKSLTIKLRKKIKMRNNKVLRKRKIKIMIKIKINIKKIKRKRKDQSLNHILLIIKKNPKINIDCCEIFFLDNFKFILE